MSVKRIELEGGKVVKWDVRFYEDGRGSKRTFRRFDRRVDADDFLRKITEEMHQKKLNPFAAVTFNNRTFDEESQCWLDDGRIRFSASHIKRTEATLRELSPRFGKLTLDKFTPELISQYQKDEKKKGLANASVNRKTNIISATLNFSVKQRRIPFNPMAGYRKLSDAHPEMCFWDQDEAADFLRHMNDLYPVTSNQRWVYAVYLLALNTAMRAGEIWGLQPMDISNDGETILVRRQFNRVTHDFGPTKGKKSRLVPCPEALQKELSRIITQDELKNTETIFRNEKGNPVCHDNFADRHFQKDLARWGGRAIRFHDMRHSATTLLISSGVDIKTVKEICGHSDVGTTMKYVHMVSGSVNKVAKTFSVVPSTVGSVTRLQVV